METPDDKADFDSFKNTMIQMGIGVLSSVLIWSELNKVKTLMMDKVYQFQTPNNDNINSDTTNIVTTNNVVDNINDTTNIATTTNADDIINDIIIL